ncbi:hypothetical protein [Streptomyces sp. NBC_00691]|uniref:hypothetical protein n=1 Tax=Streptomyces sp. NBC_00691 TaxID=2903671 RepID=UPI002E3098E6|nr:hypothetical protein [Streptomyces sp. NBC_00691]
MRRRLRRVLDGGHGRRVPGVRITPLGDLSALRVFVWQFDGLVVVLAGVLMMNAMPTASGAALLATGAAACCVRAGLRRTGWSLRPFATRLGRV